MSTQPKAAAEALTGPYVLEWEYRRSLGPVMSRFFTGLRDGKLTGVKTAAGRVLCPPVEYDPETGEAVGDFVDLKDTGVVTTWAWQGEPRPNNALQRPFAWALVRLDGATTAMLHMVDPGDKAKMRTGMRVRAKWKPERVGFITDIECFVPEGA